MSAVVACPDCRQTLAAHLPSGHIESAEGKGRRGFLVLSGSVLVRCGRWIHHQQRYCGGSVLVQTPAVTTTIGVASSAGLQRVI